MLFLLKLLQGKNVKRPSRTRLSDFDKSKQNKGNIFCNGPAEKLLENVMHLQDVLKKTFFIIYF